MTRPPADPTEPLRIGVIGLGLIAQVAHIPALLRLRPDVAISHLCDVSPGLAELIAERLPGDPMACAAWSDLIGEGQPDAVVVCTPGSHGRIAEAMLTAGISVLAEKPLCLTVAEADRLAAISASTGAVLEVAYMKAHDPVTRLAAEEYAALADPRLVRVTVQHPDQDPQVSHVAMVRGGPLDDAATREVEASVTYENQRAADGVGDDPDVAAYYRDVLNGSVVHEMSLLRAVTGTLPTWTWAEARPFGAGEPPCLQAIGHLGDRTQVVLSWNFLPTYPDYEEEFAVLADDGRMSMWMEPPYTKRRTTLTIDRATSTDGEPIRNRTTSNAGYTSSFDQQMADFVGTVRGGPTVAGPAEVAADLRCVQQLAALVAASAGRTIGGEAATR